ncbi:hypothetical protein [Hymenobacter sp. HSC-4F20]|nr:hypothetical protein [Hymenobacter sp. HSC-4F20]
MALITFVVGLFRPRPGDGTAQLRQMEKRRAWYEASVWDKSVH